jgi:hypothetical protein
LRSSRPQSAQVHDARLLLLFPFSVLSIVYGLNRKSWAVWPLER